MTARGKPFGAVIPAAVFRAPIAVAATPCLESAVSSTPIDVFQLLFASPAAAVAATRAVWPAVFAVPVGEYQVVSGLLIASAVIPAYVSVAATPFGAPIAVFVANLADGLVVPAIPVDVSQSVFGHLVAFVATVAPSVFGVLTAVADEPVPQAASPRVFEFPELRLWPAAVSVEPAIVPTFSPETEDFPVGPLTMIWTTHLSVQ